MTTEYHPSDFQILETETGYTQKQLRKIKNKFDQMDKHGKGYVSVDDLLDAVPGLRDMPLALRACRGITDASPSSGD